MEEINKIFEKLQDTSQLDEVRYEIATLIKSFLKERGEEIDNWEKSCIASAIGSLHSNLSKQQSESDAWLRHSLVNIEKAYTPKEERNEKYTTSLERIQNIDSAMLIRAVNEIV
jgi:hypothetical protein